MPKDRALREINEQLGGRTIVIGATTSSGGGAVTDHGTLAGLGDDDHPQYLNATRHAAIDADLHGSGTATDGQVLTADGSGDAAWETPATADHDHSGDAGDGGQLDWDDVWSDAVHSHASDAEGGTFDAANLTSGVATDGHVLTADGAGGAAWEAGGGSPDAGDVTYTPNTATDWDSDSDPGDVDNALDQLAERVDDLEGAGYLTSVDAGDVTYTPTTAADWDSDSDPGDLDDALDQLAERVDDLEGATASHVFTFGTSGELETGTGALKLHAPWACTITNVTAAVGTAPVDASLIVDVNIDGTTAFTTQGNRPTITTGNTTDLSSTPDVTAVSAGEYLTMDIDQVGSTTAGSDLIVQVRVTVP